MVPRSSVAALIAVLFLVLPTSAEKGEAPKAFHAKTYPARDEHPSEQVTIAADPFDTPQKAAFFAGRYRERGLLPMRLIITNDGDQPVSLADLKIELITVDKVKITPAERDDIYRRLSHLKRRGDEPSRNPLPVPLPRRKTPASVDKEVEEELEAMQFRALAVEPRSTRSGFLFFDVQGLSHPLAGARLYISGLKDEEGQPLIFFEIAMEKYLTYTPPTSR